MPYNTQRIATMKTLSLVFAAALFFECYTLSVASPMGKTEDSSLEQDTFASLLNDEATENSLNDADLEGLGKTRGSRVIVVGDPSLWKELRLLYNGLSLYKRRAADDNSQVIEHRDAGHDLNIPILRRDTMRAGEFYSSEMKSEDGFNMLMFWTEGNYSSCGSGGLQLSEMAETAEVVKEGHWRSDLQRQIAHLLKQTLPAELWSSTADSIIQSQVPLSGSMGPDDIIVTALSSLPLLCLMEGWS
ncbi:hypothetical protein Q5P01_024446 [Channa striata]|uniref:Melanin-concentrating hormone n=1 Tax=Channa striata TaxID=64152 RepID=A0AA88J472_CHASR|nr:hypothetical protein Q5P01_024446 [Channa striata]